MDSNLWFNPYDDTADFPTEITASRKTALNLMSKVLDEMPDCPQKWAVVLAVGTVAAVGIDVAAMATKAATTPKDLIRRAAGFCKANHLHPSPHLRRAAEWYQVHKHEPAPPPPAPVVKRLRYLDAGRKL